MKIPKESFDLLKNAITPLDTKENRQCYRDGNFARAENCKDKNMRYRWDLYWASKANSWVVKLDLNDSHINTALKKIIAPL